MNTFWFSSRRIFFFHYAKSTILGKADYLGLFLSRKLSTCLFPVTTFLFFVFFTFTPSSCSCSSSSIFCWSRRLGCLAWAVTIFCTCSLACYLSFNFRFSSSSSFFFSSSFCFWSFCKCSVCLFYILSTLSRFFLRSSSSSCSFTSSITWVTYRIYFLFSLWIFGVRVLLMDCFLDESELLSFIKLWFP